uniref:CSON002166 protein n=1 Tax=Culicoides sonorensis TaxID=179676 RepID=A0A336MIT2_CULSO
MAIILGIFIALICIVQADISLKNGKKASTKLDPALRKALLKALTNLEKEDESAAEETNEEDEFNTTVESETQSYNDEVLEESTNVDDLTQRVHYHSFVADGNSANNNNTNQAIESEEEIIKTIIIKKPKTTLTPPFEEDNKVDNFDEPNPILENNDFAIDSIQLARSVVTSTVNANDLKKENKEDNNKRVSLPKRKPSTTRNPTTTTPATTTVYVPEPVTNEDGENIEKVKDGDVKIYKAIDVAALTVLHDNAGVPRHVIPLHLRNPQEEIRTKPIMAFNIDSEPQFTTTQKTTIEPITTSPLVSLSVSSSLTQTSTTPSPINTFFDTSAIEQRQREIEQQIAYLKEQQRQQEELLRQQQALREQEFLKRQQQLLYEERLRVEEENRKRLQREHERQQKLEQEQHFTRFRQRQDEEFRFQQQQFQQQQQQNFQQSQQQFQQQQSRNSIVQVVPSIQLPHTHTVAINVEQQLPIKPASDFQSRNVQSTNNFNQLQQFNQNQQTQTNNVQITKSTEQKFVPQISTVPQLPQKPPQNFLIFQPSNAPLPPLVGPQQQLPIKPFQNFNSGSNFTPQPQRQTSSVQITQSQSLNPVHSADIVAQQLVKNRVFRNDAAQTGNFGFNQAQNQQRNNNFRPSQPLSFQPSSVDQQNIQNLLLNSGVSFNQKSAEEDFNIITKVLALNHGIEPSQTNNLGLGFGQQQRRFR